MGGFAGGGEGGFGEEFVALGYAEAVLLIYDAESEGMEDGIVGEEGVGANNDVYFSVFDLFF
ncbi:hypothetical protein IJ096_03290 [Candidatus Saccharibacteria bacterium]|nr:hypothetical protein [Candidatus Saccharibacteria bacterium]